MEFDNSRYVSLWSLTTADMLHSVVAKPSLLLTIILLGKIAKILLFYIISKLGTTKDPNKEISETE